MSGTGAEVLHRLETDGPTRLTALAVAVGVSQPAMTQLVQRFERQGLVVRRVDSADRRGAVVALTEAGGDVLAQRRCDIRERLAARLKTLGDEDRATLELASRVALPIIAELRGVAPTSNPQQQPPAA